MAQSILLPFQDYRPCEVFNIEFLIDNSQLGFLVSDAEKNLVLYMYQPESRESCGGKFMRNVSFHEKYRY